MRPTDWSPVDYGSDPIPGDPTIVLTGGQDYLEVADAILSAERRLRSLDIGSLVESEAVDALAKTADEVAGNIARAEKRYRAAGNALVAYAPKLENAQRESYDALLSARSAQDAAAESRTLHTHYLRLADDAQEPSQSISYRQLSDNYESDAHTALAQRSQAISRVHDAIHVRDVAAQSAIGQIREITKSDDLNDSWWDNWGKDVLSVITDVAGWVSAIAGVLALLVSWIPVVGQLLAGALLVIAGIAAIVNALGNIVLASTGDRSWAEAGLSIAGAVLSCVGMGAAVRLVAKAMTLEKVTMKVGQQITVRQAMRLKPSDWSQWVKDMRTPVPQPRPGQPLWRVYGGDARPTGGSFSPVDPASLPNPRMQLGLPNNNAMSDVVVATLDDPGAVQVVRHALPYDGNLGGAPEYRIPWDKQPGGITVLSDTPFVVR
ncbi:hypothetical protein [Parafrigoribacterium soli]|uniref:hypothetical protein n=1 Tax=Parafrigoribacterium soli TaxID=3144663 RepID=UPI0032EE9E99